MSEASEQQQQQEIEYDEDGNQIIYVDAPEEEQQEEEQQEQQIVYVEQEEDEEDLTEVTFGLTSIPASEENPLVLTLPDFEDFVVFKSTENIPDTRMIRLTGNVPLAFCVRLTFTMSGVSSTHEFDMVRNGAFVGFAFVDGRFLIEQRLDPAFVYGKFIKLFDKFNKEIESAEKDKDEPRLEFWQKQLHEFQLKHSYNAKKVDFKEQETLASFTAALETKEQVKPTEEIQPEPTVVEQPQVASQGKKEQLQSQIAPDTPYAVRFNEKTDLYLTFRELDYPTCTLEKRLPDDEFEKRQLWVLTLDGYISLHSEPAKVIEVRNSKLRVFKKGGLKKDNKEGGDIVNQVFGVIYTLPNQETDSKYIFMSKNRKLILDEGKEGRVGLKTNKYKTDAAQKWLIYTYQ